MKHTKNRKPKLTPERQEHIEAGRNLPPHVSQRVGCKVYWMTYATLEEAKIAQAWAIKEAEYRYSLGYDSGWCVPGGINEQRAAEDCKLKGGFEVCFL
jgi:hypothetical protein